MIRSFSVLALFFAALLVCRHADARQNGVASESPIAIRAGALVDVASGTLDRDVVILVRGHRIETVGTDVRVPPGADVVDLSDRFVLPGLIDAHTHVTSTPNYEDVNPILFKSVPYRTVEAVAAARNTLMAGFTTIRDVDSEGADWADVAVRDAINDGLIPGPRMQVATLAISITGGYMNTDVAPGIEVPQFGSLADSPAEIVKTLREQVKHGADWIKLYATGTTRHIDLENMEPLAQFSDEDIQLVVDEAARFDKPVATHAYGGHAALAAVEAGVRSVEHGMLLSDETLDRMVERGTFWVPTLSVYFPGEGEEMTERQRVITESHRRVFGRAVEKGVRIAYGTDAGALPHGKNAVDFEKMVDYGMSPAQALRSATIVAAELMQWDDRIGSIEEGKMADIIAVDGNPLEDIGALWDVSFVMKDGQVYRHDE
jgi:imidazolonepropionase-like amidohydrolase